MTALLDVHNLHAETAEKKILRGVSLQIQPGEVHAIMGPNGAGKSTLAHILARHASYTVTSGDITYNQQSLLDLSPEEGAQQGIFLSFQYPVALPGISNVQFLKTTLNALRKAKGEPELDAFELLQRARRHLQTIDMNEDLLYRSVNDGFSGGEKKRNEILQMLMLAPKLAILDETDSGLDIDSLKAVANGINALRQHKTAILLITHYQRLLDYVEPDHIHVMLQGRIVHSGDKTLAHTLEERGYGWLEETSS